MTSRVGGRTPKPPDRDFVPALAKKARVKYDRHENKTMLLYPERGLALNESAAAIVNKIDGTKSVLVIATELAEETGGDREEIVRDVIAFLDGLRGKGLV